MKLMSNGKVFTQGGYTNSEKANMIKNGENSMMKLLAEKFSEIYGTKKPTVTEPKANTITNIRKAVATLANKIHSKIKNLSAAFKKAWEVIKGKAIKSKVAGVSFNQKALQRLKMDDDCKELGHGLQPVRYLFRRQIHGVERRSGGCDRRSLFAFGLSDEMQNGEPLLNLFSLSTVSSFKP